MHFSPPVLRFALAATAAFLGGGTAPLVLGGDLLQAGPMVGHVDASSGRVWLRLQQRADLEARAEQEGLAVQPARRHYLGEGFWILEFQGLGAARPTRVHLRATRPGWETETAEVGFRTAPAPGATGRVRLAFGSCSKLSQYPRGPVYQAMAAEGADLAVFVGDNSYFIAGTGGEGHFGTTGPRGDWSFPESMMARHLATRTHPDLQALFRSTPCYAVWDDHDYGPNNADAHFPLREEAAAMFRRAWANPAYGTAEVPGIFSAFRFGPVEIFLMDDRYHKHSPQVHGDVSPETGRIWGEGQLAWLMRGLRASTAPVKCIANGTQILARDDRGEGHFQEAQGELRQLLEVLEEARIGGVIFLTGDRHYTEVNRQEQPGGALLVEFTSSPLQQGQEIGPLERRQANQVWGMSGNSYGLVTVDIPREGEGTVRFEARDAGNRAPVIAGRECVSTWNLADLQY